MKTCIWNPWSLSVVLLLCLLGNGCAHDSSSPTAAEPANQDSGLAAQSAEAPADAAPPTDATQDLENAPAKIISTPAADPAVSLSASASGVAKLAQSGVDESVMLAFVMNSAQPFNLGADQVIYLNDIGVPTNVVTAMMERDRALAPAAVAPAEPAVFAAQPVPATSDQPEPAPATEVSTLATDAPAEGAAADTYFYDSLAPYGNWIELEGYGRCWQPSVVVVNRDWTPYCDRGRWVYSDCGWYWVSDYSWGWAPFHYGRWFRHNFWGWCWVPDRVWGPSWVNWRYNAGYCGWAPLPPRARYVPGIGFSYLGKRVGINFGFGLASDAFTFVAANHFCDSQPSHHRMPHNQVTRIFGSTTIINPVAEDHANPRYHRGIPIKHVEQVTRTDIKPITVQETRIGTSRQRGENFDRVHGIVTAFRPTLTAPTERIRGGLPGSGVRPVDRSGSAPTMDREDKSPRTGQRNSTPPVIVNSRTPDLRHEKVSPIAIPHQENPQVRNPLETQRNPAPSVGRDLPAGSIYLRGAQQRPEVVSKTLPAQNPWPQQRQGSTYRSGPAIQTIPVANQSVLPEAQALRERRYSGQPQQDLGSSTTVQPGAPKPNPFAPATRMLPKPAPTTPTPLAPTLPRPQWNPRGYERFAPATPDVARIPVAPIETPHAPPAPRYDPPRVAAPAAPQPAPPAVINKTPNYGGGGAHNNRPSGGRR